MYDDYGYEPPAWRQAAMLFALVLGTLLVIIVAALMVRALWEYIFTNLPAEYRDPEAVAPG